MTTQSKLHPSDNVRKFTKELAPGERIAALVRYDDTCRNGHNTLSITGTFRRNYTQITGGCIHEEIAEHFPALAPFIKWHLCSPDGPMHYVANSMHWAGKNMWQERNLENFRSTAIWPDATEYQMDNVTPAILQARLPALMVEFRAAVEALGFIY